MIALRIFMAEVSAPVVIWATPEDPRARSAASPEFESRNGAGERTGHEDRFAQRAGHALEATGYGEAAGDEVRFEGVTVEDVDDDIFGETIVGRFDQVVENARCGGGVFGDERADVPGAPAGTEEAVTGETIILRSSPNDGRATRGEVVEERGTLGVTGEAVEIEERPPIFVRHRWRGVPDPRATAPAVDAAAALEAQALVDGLPLVTGVEAEDGDVEAFREI
jgi:hypothetical protein